MPWRQPLFELPVRHAQIDPIVTNFFSSLLSILTSQAEGELRYGMALPSSCERSLKKLLADMGDDAE